MAAISRDNEMYASQTLPRSLSVFFSLSFLCIEYIYFFILFYLLVGEEEEEEKNMSFDNTCLSPLSSFPPLSGGVVQFGTHADDINQRFSVLVEKKGDTGVVP